ncbi:hypothetical protein VTN96DRAFT_513 [Rasamsonia emersonii]
MGKQQRGLCTATTMDQQRQKFYHPYSPYEIQLQFMRALYDCIESGKIGIFESPTGTVCQLPSWSQALDSSCF